MHHVHMAATDSSRNSHTTQHISGPDQPRTQIGVEAQQRPGAGRVALPRPLLRVRLGGIGVLRPPLKALRINHRVLEAGLRQRWAAAMINQCDMQPLSLERSSDACRETAHPMCVAAAITAW